MIIDGRTRVTKTTINPSPLNLHERSTGCDFTNVFRARFSQNVTRKKTFVLNMRAKNARENVGEIDPWMRCCKETLSTFDVVNHDGSWKQLYIEKYIENIVEKFQPIQSDMFDIKDLLPMFEPR